MPDLSLATVYRNLTLFKQEGDIVSVGVVNGLERFDGDTSPHAHFMCMQCHAVHDVAEVEVPKNICEQVSQALEAEVNSAALHFTGTCKSCQTTS